MGGCDTVAIVTEFEYHCTCNTGVGVSGCEGEMQGEGRRSDLVERTCRYDLRRRTVEQEGVR